MEIIQAGTSYDFVGVRKWAFIVSGLMILASIVSLVAHGGPNYGIDFTGGTMVQVRFKDMRSIDEVRSALAASGMGDALIQDFTDAFAAAATESGSEFLVRLPLTEDEEDLDESKQVTAALEQAFGKDDLVIQRVERVGPLVGQSLRRQAILAVVFATVMMGVYIWFRFELRFGVGALVALVHDVIITLGALSILNFEVDLTVVAALLTVVGFSVNDTVIISDRIRENRRKNRRDPLHKIVNASINETLSRTIITTGTATLVILALFFLGGNVIHAFAFALLVGFIVGTFSSVFIASPIVLLFEPAVPQRGH
jgi:preprotein translocase subunit SecF